METQRKETIVEKNYVGRNLYSGLIILIMGLVFLAKNYGFEIPEKWWLLFFFLPMSGIISKIWKTFQLEKQLSSAILGQVTGLLFMAFIGLALLFDWNWDKIWPGFFIIAGLSRLLGDRKTSKV